MIRIRRAYEPPGPADGARFLVDRLWPRGVTKEALAMHTWCKEAAPSNELRRWYHHAPEQWTEFKRRYFAELEANSSAWKPIAEAAREGNVTLLYASIHVEQNNAVALKEFLVRKLGVVTSPLTNNNPGLSSDALSSKEAPPRMQTVPPKRLKRLDP